jgi:hypothetical protein
MATAMGSDKSGLFGFPNSGIYELRANAKSDELSMRRFKSPVFPPAMAKVLADKKQQQPVSGKAETCLCH